MRRLSPNLAPLGYSPRRYLPLSPAPVLGMGERLTDLREMQLLFANGELGGYWPADPAYAFEDSAGTTAASANGVVGYRTDVALGKHAVQATTANKPYLRRTPTTGKYWYDSNTATGAMNVTFASALGSACTIATVTPEGVSILYNQTVGTTYNITPPYGYNSDVLIINRALTPAEKALVTRVFQRSVPGLGPNLIVNGGFDIAAGWYFYGSAPDVEISDGVLKFNSTTNNSAYQTISGPPAGSPFMLKLTVVSRARGNAYLTSYTGSIYNQLNTVKSYTFSLLATAGADFRIVGGSPGVGGECVIDNVSIQAIL